MDKIKEIDKTKRARGHLLKGQIGEIYSKYIIKEKGYRVLNLSKRYLKNLYWFLDGLNKKERIIELINKNKGIPDFICRKGKEVIFIEVKTNNSYLSKNQVTFFQELKKEFPVFIWNISFDFNLKDINISECNEEYIKISKKRLENYEKWAKDKKT